MTKSQKRMQKHRKQKAKADRKEQLQMQQVQKEWTEGCLQAKHRLREIQRNGHT